MIVLTSIGSFFAVSNAFTDAYILPKWLCLSMGVAFISAYCGGKLVSKNKRLYLYTDLIYQSIVIVCMMQALLGIVQYFDFFRICTNFPVVGSFENPAGFVSCICAGLPLGYQFFNKKNPYHWICVVISFIAILLSYSRTGLISFLLIGIVLYFQQIKIKRKCKLLFIILFILLCLGLTTLYKTDSAKGRLLIWTCSWEMIKDSPLWGYGIGGFKTYYMDYQAAYFKTSTTNEYAMLADNINRPFNEYVALLVQFGLIGMIGLILLLLFLIRCYYRNPTLLGKSSLLSLLAIGICCMFSYPLKYPYVWFILILDCITIIYCSRSKWYIPSNIKTLIGVSSLVFALFLSHKTMKNIWLEFQWKNNLVTSQPIEQKLNRYEYLLNKSNNNPYLLYNYSTELYYAKRHRESLEIAFKCKEYWSDYDLEMLIGENFKQLHKFSDAIKHFETASFMCPVKFMPLYRIFQIYKHLGENEELYLIAKRLINKPIKVESYFINKVKKEAQEIINNMNQ